MSNSKLACSIPPFFKSHKMKQLIKTIAVFKEGKIYNCKQEKTIIQMQKLKKSQEI